MVKHLEEPSISDLTVTTDSFSDNDHDKMSVNVSTKITNELFNSNKIQIDFGEDQSESPKTKKT